MEIAIVKGDQIVTQQLLSQLPLTRKAKNAFALAHSLANASNTNIIQISHLAIALILSTNSFDQLYNCRVDKLPESVKDIIAKGKQNFRKKVSEPKDWIISDALISILDITVPSSEMYRFKSQKFIRQIDTIHLAYALIKVQSPFIRQIQMIHGLCNEENVILEEVESNIQSYYDNRSFYQKKNDSTGIIKKLRNKLTTLYPSQDTMITDVCHAVQKCLLLRNSRNCEGDRVRESMPKPVALLLMGIPGTDSKQIANCIEQVFIETGYQNGTPFGIDLAAYVHRETFEFALLGDQQSYKQAQPGMLYNASVMNPFGTFRIENLGEGNISIMPLLESFMSSNPPSDHFWNKKVNGQNMFVIATMSLTSEMNDFLSSSKDLSQEAIIDALTGTDKTVGLKNFLRLIDAYVYLPIPTEEASMELAKSSLEKYITKLKGMYHVSFQINDLDRLATLVVRGDSEILTPQQVRTKTQALLSSCEYCLQDNDNIRDIFLTVDEIPVYNYPQERRFKRGDYLTYKVVPKKKGNRLEMSITNIHYTQTAKRKIAEWLTLENPVHVPQPIGVAGPMKTLQYYLNALTDSRFHKDDATFNYNNRGLLFYGPPGNGKTTLIRYCAFKSHLPIIRLSAADLNLDNIPKVFKIARDYGPLLLIIEEIDTLKSRKILGIHHDVINELLQQVDGISMEHPFLIIATSNYPNDLDEALFRQGRIGEIVEIPLPNREARKQYISSFCADKGRNIVLSDQRLVQFAKMTDEMSFAQIEGLLQDCGMTIMHSGKPCTSELFSKMFLERLVKWDQGNQTYSIGFKHNIQGENY